MKIIKTSLLALSLFGLAVATDSCSSDPEYDASETINVTDGNFRFDNLGVWTLNTQNSDPFNIDDYEFSHLIDNGYVYGFTPSNTTSKTDLSDYYNNANKLTPVFPYAAAAGSGINGGDAPYLVGYWSDYFDNNATSFRERSCAIWEEEGETFKPQSVMVCCNTYLKEAVLNGTDFNEKFGPDGWVTLTAHGVHLDGTENTLDFFLVNNGPVVVDKWTEFDLSGLGACIGLYFTMDSSDYSTYGGVKYLNIPTYFCIDKLVVND